ncbi:MAG: hypothetical protein NTV52_19515 [Acidobacteria bacterium]|nr:hypothetical protein [Acidobacteriota bacterium]
MRRSSQRRPPNAKPASIPKTCKVTHLALKTGAPIIGLNDSGGARSQAGALSIVGYADIFLRHTIPSGVIPQSPPSLHPAQVALTDFVVTGPNIIKTATHDDLSKADLGGPPIRSSPMSTTTFATSR